MAERERGNTKVWQNVEEATRKSGRMQKKQHERMAERGRGNTKVWQNVEAELKEGYSKALSGRRKYCRTWKLS